MRLLHAGPDHERGRSPPRRPCRQRSRAHPRRHERKSLPLRRLYRNRRSGPGSATRARRTRQEASRMKNFDYLRPATIAEAVAAAAVPGSAYLAGGTNLLDLMKGGVSRPDRLVDISRLPGLDRIEHPPDGSTRIGALMRNADLAYDPEFARRFPAVAEALLSGAS